MSKRILQKEADTFCGRFLFPRLLILALCLSNRVFAFDPFEMPLLNPGQSRVGVGGGATWGIVSPPDNFDHVTGVSDARLYEENVSYARGIGHGRIQNGFIEVESKMFQSRQETVGATRVHAGNNGWAMTSRIGGWFSRRMGGWLQAGSPILMERAKFVNPVIHYFGAGLYAEIPLTDNLSLLETAFIGSGQFKPRRRNPAVQDTLLAALNLGKMLGDKDFILKAGGFINYDLTRRIDPSYQTSPVGSGRIKNAAFVTPFMAEFPFGEAWRVNGGYTMEWIGRSVRGSKFAFLNLTTEF